MFDYVDNICLPTQSHNDMSVKLQLEWEGEKVNFIISFNKRKEMSAVTVHNELLIINN